MEEMFGLRPGSGRNGETLQAGPTAPGGLWVAFGFFGGHNALQSLWRRSRRVRVEGKSWRIRRRLREFAEDA
jgi:hypothetical protein